MPAYAYRRDVLDALAGHGVRPTQHTRPELVHEFVSDLYRFELRRLRDRLRSGEFPKREYFDLVVALRRKYAIISMRPTEWMSDQVR
jgi:hypothetical protein